MGKMWTDPYGASSPINSFMFQLLFFLFNFFILVSIQCWSQATLPQPHYHLAAMLVRDGSLCWLNATFVSQAVDLFNVPIGRGKWTTATLLVACSNLASMSMADITLFAGVETG